MFELHFLDKGHPEYKRLRAMFVSNWLHERPVGGVSVVAVIKIEMPEKMRERHNDYKRVVKNVGKQFHGTSCSGGCYFHTGGPICLRPDCAACNICKGGFKIGDNVGHSPMKCARLKYGRGVYFSTVSGKANDFAYRTAKVADGGLRVRFMFVADVAIGVPFVMTKDSNFQHLTRPPQGCDSLMGKVGEYLRYDETVVYNEAAARPTHIISYRF